MNQGTLVVGSAMFAVAMLAVAGYVALSLGGEQELAELEGIAELSGRLEQVSNHAEGNLVRVNALAKKVRNQRGELNQSAEGEHIAAVWPPVQRIEPGPLNEEPDEDKPVEVASSPQRRRIPVPIDASSLHGIVNSATENMAILDGEVYRQGDLYEEMRILAIREESVLFETLRGEPKTMALNEGTPERTTP